MNPADPADAAPDETDAVVDEQDKVTRLVRWVGTFLAFPGLTIGFAFILFDDPADHAGHIFLSLMFGFSGVIAILLARRVAVRYA